jgi:hypothetical protein
MEENVNANANANANTNTNDMTLPCPTTVYDKHIHVEPVFRMRGHPFVGCRLRLDRPKNQGQRWREDGERVGLGTVILGAEATKIVDAVDKAIETCEQRRGGSRWADKSPMRLLTVQTACGKPLNVNAEYMGELDQWVVVVEIIHVNPLLTISGRIDGYSMDAKNARMFADMLTAAITNVEDYNSKITMMLL